MSHKSAKLEEACPVLAAVAVTNGGNAVEGVAGCEREAEYAGVEEGRSKNERSHPLDKSVALVEAVVVILAVTFDNGVDATREGVGAIDVAAGELENENDKEDP